MGYQRQQSDEQREPPEFNSPPTVKTKEAKKFTTDEGTIKEKYVNNMLTKRITKRHDGTTITEMYQHEVICYKIIRTKTLLIKEEYNQGIIEDIIEIDLTKKDKKSKKKKKKKGKKKNKRK